MPAACTTPPVTDIDAIQIDHLARVEASVGAEAMPAVHPFTIRRAFVGVAADGESDPFIIGGDIADAIGRDLPELGDGEVAHPDRLGMPL